MGRPTLAIRVPATTANLGPGFDCAALALTLYMEVEAEKADAWEVVYEGEEYAGLAGGEENLIVRTMQETARKCGAEAPPCRLAVHSDIPLGKGLGSSATAVAAGIEAADHLYGLGLSVEEKARIGSGIEGHADNVVAAIMGGAVFSHYMDGELETVHIPHPHVGAVILVPDRPLATEESRGLLPDTLRHADAVCGSAATGVMAAAIAVGDWKRAGRMMERDVFHEPYRTRLFPDFDQIRHFAKKAGAYGTAVSGAGPSVLVLTEPDSERSIAQRLAGEFPAYRPLAVKASSAGAATVTV
ncbi:homoserine kinase [Bhargavaea beijingensis]|uniref:homoserine kinase n=1 Tax=Bhargavaea beijingensis TaxID=426756 RepID=UPI0022243F8E|nr:homoserine kinase [Bhargavaea beijingensis]MCW1929619.1 homoserine kinase [Bhargavaea beijingensis]